MRAVVSSGRMVPQPEGLQEAGQRWEVYDLTEACADISGDRIAAADDDTNGGARPHVQNGDGSRTDADTPSSAQRHPLHPTSCRVLRELAAAGEGASPPYMPLKAQLSSMAAGVHVRPHTGPTNQKLTVHYGLEVPAGTDGRTASTIRVGRDTRPFVPRGLLVFDDSFEHEVWQNASTTRTTLVLHVAHPELAKQAALMQGAVIAVGARGQQSAEK